MNRLIIFLILLLQFAVSKADILPTGVYYSHNEKNEYTITRIAESVGANFTVPKKITIETTNDNRETVYNDYPIIAVKLNSGSNKTLKTLNAPYIKSLAISGNSTPSTGYLELQKIVLGDAIESITFLTGCPKLKELVWNPSNIKNIGNRCFDGLSELNLGSVRFSKKLESIGSYAFRGCTNLKNIYLSDCSNLKQIETGTFSGSGIIGLTLPNGLTRIGSSAFYNCKELFPGSTGTLDLPKSCTKIESSAFENCSKLKNVKAYGWKTSLADVSHKEEESKGKNIRQFQGCTSLESISLPNELEYIPQDAFLQCENLKIIRTEEYQNQNVVIFPSTVKIIGDNAFFGCKSLTNKTTSNGEPIDILMPDDIELVDWLAFSGCTGLISVSFPHPVTRKIIAYTESFEKCTNLKHIKLHEPKKKDKEQSESTIAQTYPLNLSTTGGLVVEDNAFLDCPNVCSLPASAGVMSWKDSHWWYDEREWIITDVFIPYYVKDVTKNEVDALPLFNYFSDIKNVYFHSATASVSQGALSSCINVDRVVFYAPEAEEQAEAQALQIAPNAFAANKKLVNVECYYLVPPVIEESVFANETYKAGCLTVPEGTIELYSKANGWKNFSLITDGQQSSISQIEASGNDCPAEYFDLQGRPVNRDNAAPGLYIRRQGSTSSKVVIR